MAKSKKKIIQKRSVKKRPSRVKKLLGWFSPLSPLKGAVLFALLFGILGGSYLAYKSFAATPNNLIGHLFDEYFTFPVSATGYTGTSIDLQPNIDGSPDGYYYANNIWFTSNSQLYYGLQTSGSAPTGKIAIFSVWDAIAAEGPQYHASFGGEGVGYSVRISYPWITGRKYTMRVTKSSDDGVTSWWSGYVKDTVTNVESYIGRIQINGNRGNLSASSAAFHERYQGPSDSCSQPRVSQVTFSNPLMSPGGIKPKSAYSNANVISTCPGYAYERDLGGYRYKSYAGIQPPRVLNISANSTGDGLILDAYGRAWNLGNTNPGVKDDPRAPFWPNKSIAKRLVKDPNSNAYYVLDGFGGIHPGYGAKAVSGNAYWSGWDIARDLVITDWSIPSGYTLDGYGGIHPFGGAPVLAATDGHSWPGWDIARRLVINPTKNGGYVMDGFAGLHRIGSQPRANGASYFSGQDIARTVLLNPTNTGGYVLDGSGGVHPFAVGSNVKPLALTGLAYWAGNTGIATDLVITNWTTRAGYTLDYRGGVHRFGGAPAVRGNPYW